MILKNHTSAPIRKKRMSPTRKAGREASQNKFVEKGGVPNRIESFPKINSSKNRLRTRLGYVKPIQNGPRKEQNLIYRRPSWCRERMELDSKNKSRRDRMMRSKSFETQEMKEISWKEAGESRPFFWMEIIEDVFQMEGKKCKER